MCPVVFLSVLVSILILFLEAASSFQVQFNPSYLKFMEEDVQHINFTITGYIFDRDSDVSEFQLRIMHPNIADVPDGKNRSIYLRKDDFEKGTAEGTFEIVGKFLGMTDLFLVEAKAKDPPAKTTNNHVELVVTRKATKLTFYFTVSVAILVTANYINMGCALDMGVVKSVLKRPIAPGLGFLCQYLVMPITSYLVGLLLLGDSTHLRLGLFIFGCSPAGGASNMWTVLLNGNLDLSITMTFISTIAATFYASSLDVYAWKASVFGN